MAPKAVAGKQTPQGHGLPGPKPQKGQSTMVKTFSKPQPARQVVSEAWHYTTRSQSNPGEVYTLKRTPAGWACSCLGYFHGGVCKHIGQLERRAEREGWVFGTIAPLSRVARYFPLDNDPRPEPPAVAPVSLEDARARRRAALADLYGAAD